MTDVLIIPQAQPFAIPATYGLPGTAGAPGPAGASYASRTLLAAVSSPSNNSVAWLSEAGREGQFQFSTANLSAMVTADPQQGVYVAPAGASTGASGAWVRKFSGALNITWFGATGAGSPTNDASKIQATIDFSYATRLVDVADNYGVGAGTAVYIPTPAVAFYCGGTTLTMNHTFKLYGDGSGDPAGVAAVLKWNGTCTGIHPTSTSPGHRIEGITFLGGFTTTEGEFHAIMPDVVGEVRDCLFRDWPGDAVNEDEGVHAGQTNGYLIDRIYTENCRNSHSSAGSDCNAGEKRGIQSKFNRQCGVLQGGFLGDHYYSGSHNGAARSTWNTGLTGHPASYCHVAGHRYAVIGGQETWCSTNAPYSSTVTMTIASPGVITWTAHGLPNGMPVGFSTTGALPTGLVAGTIYYVVNATTNTFQVAATVGGAAINTTGSQSGTHTCSAAKSNTGWAYWQDGPADTNGVPTWFTGMVCRVGGAYVQQNLNNGSTFVACYAEDNNPSQFDRGSVLLNPFMSYMWLVSGGALYGTKDHITGNDFQFTNRASPTGLPIVTLGQSVIEDENTSSLCDFWNLQSLAGGVSVSVRFQLGLEADGVTRANLARIYAQSTSGSPATAAAVLNFGTRTFAGGGAITDWVVLDGNNQSWRPITDNNMDSGASGTRWKAGYFYTVDAKTQFNVNGTKVLGARATGWTAPTGTPTRSTFATSTVTLSVLAEHVKALIDDLTTHGLIGT